MGDLSLKEKIYDKILYKIVKNEFSVDDFIVENQLVKMFGVSRSTVREALIELCNENILRNIPRRGYQIVKITGKEIRDAFQLRLLIETEGVKIALRYITEKDINRLNKLTLEWNLAKNESSKKLDLDEELELNAKFHLELNALSRNVMMNKVLKDILIFLRRAIAQIIVYEMDVSPYKLSYHSQIINALRERSNTKVVSFLRKDIKSYERLLKDHIWF